MRSKVGAAYMLSAIVAALAAVASAGGLFLDGLYRDNALVISAWLGNDVVTLAVMVPVLTVSLILTIRGSERARLLWVGSIGYMLYNYLFYLYGAAFNEFFLLYVALVALSLYAFILGLSSVDVQEVAQRFGAATPVKAISGVMLLIPLIMGGIELQRVVSFLLTGELPMDIVQTGHPTAVVYATDLALLMPAITLGAILLWRRQAWGYVLSTVLMVKGFSYPLALIAMSVLGTWDPLTPIYAFFCVSCLIALGLLLWNMRGGAEAVEAAGAQRGESRVRAIT
jgi:hypothetical protein